MKTYNKSKKRWVEIFIPMTLDEYQCLKNIVYQFENVELFKYSWVPYEIFTKKIQKALIHIGYGYYNKMLHGLKIKASNNRKCYVDELRVFVEYFT